MIQNLKLKNFKSFKDVDIPFGAFTLIAGTNASGKSNLRDALRFLHGVGLGYSLVEILGEKYGPGGILQWRGIRGGVGELAFQRNVFCSITCDVFLEYTYYVGITLAGQPLYSQLKEEYLYNKKNENFIWKQKTGQTDLNLIEKTESNNHLSFNSPKNKIFLAAMANQFRESKNVLNIFRSIRFLDLDSDAIRSPSQPGQNILTDRGENFSSVLQAICQDETLKNILLEWLQMLTPMDVVDFEFIADFSGKVLVHFVDSNQNKLSAFSASDGTLRFLGLLVALLNPGDGKIFFFEEFDNGIHPSRLYLLLQLVQQVCEQQGVQIIATTHNPAMLDFLDEKSRNDALLIYRNEGEADSKVRRIGDLPDVQRIIEKHGLGSLHSSGWLENTAFFSEPEDDTVDSK
jgi:AAA15 family ATPase/GTPase